MRGKTKTIQIDVGTAHRLRVFVALENAGHLYGNIGTTAALAINRYIDQEERCIDNLAKDVLNAIKGKGRG